jgi:hypothetical protein
MIRKTLFFLPSPTSFKTYKIFSDWKFFALEITKNYTVQEHIENKTLDKKLAKKLLSFAWHDS